MKKQFANGVSETSTTTGTGNVTLVQRTGYPRFNDRFAINDRVRYAIKDGNNREFGYGTYLGGHVLQRTTILGTLNAGTWTSGGSALNLTGAAFVYTDVEENWLQYLVRSEPVVLAASGTANAEAGFAYYLTGDNCVVTLPASPTVGDVIFVRAAGGTNGTIGANGNKINGVAGDMTVDLANFAFTLEYVNSTFGWKVCA